MVIKKLILHNFQSHKHTEVEFNKGINFIVGRSNAGKTTLLRAIKWVIENRPISTQGLKRFSSSNKEPIWVELHIGDNKETIVVKRYKSSTDNYYQIGKDIYRAIKTDVPKEVRSVLPFSKVNLQEQHDSYFLLTLSPSKVAQEINKYTGMEEVERAVRIVKEFLNDKRSELKVLERREYELEEKLKQLNKVVDKVGILFNKLQNVSKRWKQVKERIDSTELLVEEIKHKQSELDKYKRLDVVISKLHQLEKYTKELETISDKIIALEGLVEGYIEKERLLNKYANLSEVEEKLKEFGDLVKKTETVENNLKRINDIIVQVKKLENKLPELEQNIKDMKDKFHKLIGPTCPLCGASVRKAVI